MLFLVFFLIFYFRLIFLIFSFFLEFSNFHHCFWFYKNTFIIDVKWGVYRCPSLLENTTCYPTKIIDMTPFCTLLYRMIKRKWCNDRIYHKISCLPTGSGSGQNVVRIYAVKKMICSDFKCLDLRKDQDLGCLDFCDESGLKVLGFLKRIKT